MITAETQRRRENPKVCVGQPFRAAAALLRGAPGGSPAAGRKACPTGSGAFVIVGEPSAARDYSAATTRLCVSPVKN